MFAFRWHLNRKAGAPMAVRIRGDGWQVDFMFKGKRVRRQEGFTSKAEAEQWERAERTRLEQGNPLQMADGASCSSLKALYAATYARHWQGSKSENSATENAEDVLRILGEDRHPSSINTVAIDSLVAALKRRNLSGGTINRKLAALSKMLHHAHARSWIDSVPKIERQRESEHRIRWLTVEEEQRVLVWLSDASRCTMRDLVVLLLDTGMRLSEALTLKWVDIDEGWIRVWVNKSSKPRSIPQTSRVSAMLADRKVKIEGPFRSIDIWAAEYAWKALRDALGFAGDDQFVMHMLRHTFCSRLAQRGVPIQVIQQLAGHKSITMTMRYSHLCPSNLQAAVNTLSVGCPIVN